VNSLGKHNPLYSVVDTSNGTLGGRLIGKGKGLKSQEEKEGGVCGTLDA